MSIDETIEKAAKLFRVTVNDIKRGRRCRDPRVVIARWHVVEQHPDISANALAKAMGYANHDSIIYVRKRLAESNTHNVDTEFKG